MVIHQQRSSFPGDLLQPHDLVAVVVLGQVTQSGGNGGEVHFLQLLQFATQILLGDVGDVGGGAGEVHPAVHHHFQLLWSSEGN